jgi:hypothetical protein
LQPRNAFPQYAGFHDEAMMAGFAGQREQFDGSKPAELYLGTSDQHAAASG